MSWDVTFEYEPADPSVGILSEAWYGHAEKDGIALQFEAEYRKPPGAWALQELEVDGTLLPAKGRVGDISSRFLWAVINAWAPYADAEREAIREEERWGREEDAAREAFEEQYGPGTW